MKEKLYVPVLSDGVEVCACLGICGVWLSKVSIFDLL